MNTHSKLAQTERLAKQLDQHEKYRVLRAVPEPTFNMPPGPAPEGKCLAIIDCETTGLDVGQHELIELAILLVAVHKPFVMHRAGSCRPTRRRYARR